MQSCLRLTHDRTHREPRVNISADTTERLPFPQNLVFPLQSCPGLLEIKANNRENPVWSGGERGPWHL